jgi:hypothetical protein
MLADVGAVMRNLEDKVAAIRRVYGGTDRSAIGGLLVLRATRRNRALIRSAAAVFAARFPGSSRTWLDASSIQAPGSPTATA